MEYAQKKGAYLLHLETDVIPPIDVIERLLAHKKWVVGGLYDIFYGTKRKPMVQTIEPYGRHITAYRATPFAEEEEPLLITGKLEKVFHIGLGCVLISPEVFEKIQFRIIEGSQSHTDTWFATDCFINKIPIYLDTSLTCKHLNSTWLGKIKI